MISRGKRLGGIAAELFRFQGLRGFSTFAKALTARALWGIEFEVFLMQGLENRPVRTWRDAISYYSELEPGLRAVNWRGKGKALTVDKLATAERLAEAGLPGPTIVGVVGRDRVAFPSNGIAPSLGTVEALLADLENWPDDLFVKPATGWRGEGALGPARSGNDWRVGDRIFDDRAFAEFLLEQAPPSGLLVQRRVRSHRDLDPIGGKLGLGTFRLHTALTSSGPRFLVGLAKIMGSAGLVDNFSGGKFGNLLASIDTDSGELRKVYGRSDGQHFSMNEVERHPVTGARLNGFLVPLWPETIALAKAVTEAFPEAPLIAMDIAITDDGPVVIEVQSDWAGNIAQRFMGRGMKSILRELIPELPIESELKAEAAEIFGLNQSRMKRKDAPSAPRIS
ncbi:MAG TPA: sugar-transfer associated ATP-grasp domain-containing protein [Sphingomicrobium sp.]|nr:sugar-transfer associated ATP-grasp domain-containing protein [Sphingomicrobium sp.]